MIKGYENTVICWDKWYLKFGVADVASLDGLGREDFLGRPVLLERVMLIGVWRVNQDIRTPWDPNWL